MPRAPALAMAQFTGPSSLNPPGGMRADSVALIEGSLGLLDQIRGHRAAVLVDVERAAQRGERPLRTVVALADPATRTDRRCVLAGQVQPLRVDQPVGMPELA